MVWKAAKMEQSVIEELLQTQFTTYINRVKETDCQAELRRLLQSGPPIYISDKYGLPLTNTDDTADRENANDDTIDNDNVSNHSSNNTTAPDTHICTLWFQSDNTERSAKLYNALEGIERQQLWDELKQFIIVQGKEKGDDDDDTNNSNDNNDTSNNNNDQMA
jgi:hypothetical protein